jgi:ankyrin repeat protein
VTSRKASDNPHELVTALLEAGCDANIQENLQGRTTLHALVRLLAASVADPTSNTCDLMLETFQQLAQKSDVNLKDHRQRTPLHRLAASGCTHLKAFQVCVRH